MFESSLCARADKARDVHVAVLLIAAMLGVSTTVAPAAVFDIPPGDVPALIAAINTANSNGEANKINLAPNSTYTLTEADHDDELDGPSGLPEISSELTINGNGSTIQRAEGAEPFRFLNTSIIGDVTVNNVTFSGGYVTGIFGGGAIHNETTLRLNKCFFINNAAEENGGAIYSDNAGTVFIDEVNMSANAARIGGAVYLGSGDLIKNNCSFDNNIAEEQAGALYNIGGNVTATNCTYSNNSVTVQESGHGGGAIRSLAGGAVHLTDCNLSGNSGFDGGAISHTGTGLLELHGCTLTQNSGYFGGSIYQVAATALFIRCIISDSLITSTNGGAIYLLFAIATVIESTFSGNSAIDGGAIRNGTSSTLNLDGCTFTGNTALRGGCGRSNSTLNAVNCTFSDNLANVGGAWWIDGGSPKFTHCTAVNNTATDSGGGFRSFSGNLEVSQSIVGQNFQADIFGPWTDAGHNIIGDGVGITHPFTVSGIPAFGPLQDNGGPTWTHALLVDGSLGDDAPVAIDAGNCADGTVTVDQRGIARPQGKACDIGAFELEVPGCLTGDLNCDGVVDIDDLFILLGAWGKCDDPDDCPADLDGNNVVDIDDLFFLLGNWS